VGKPPAFHLMHLAVDALQEGGRILAGAGAPREKDQTYQVCRRHVLLRLRPEVDGNHQPQPHVGLPLAHLPLETVDGKQHIAAQEIVDGHSPASGGRPDLGRRRLVETMAARGGKALRRRIIVVGRLIVHQRSG